MKETGDEIWTDVENPMKLKILTYSSLSISAIAMLVVYFSWTNRVADMRDSSRHLTAKLPSSTNPPLSGHIPRHPSLLLQFNTTQIGNVMLLLLRWQKARMLHGKHSLLHISSGCAQALFGFFHFQIRCCLGQVFAFGFPHHDGMADGSTLSFHYFFWCNFFENLFSESS